METAFTINGTHCAACKMLLEEVIGELAGVNSVTVDYVTGQTVLHHDEEFRWDGLVQAVEKEGNYTVTMPEAKTV